ncbi:LOW QUALITY PROTEIN: uncharacterized protein [Pseudochaenichthys georgianus]|uniref:LOW QUALITY PROTEIN: uncharacterized protein n=1 Tax=Pseudochaenichthys georgianus TaxID=52239 RepID=UPI00146D67CA|nr:LOW QUALITY PROTEIN: uncharacterized protein LOC117444684 [Pseudochaenichthys georgianus]
MAKIQAHSTAKQINQIQEKPYVITQKQVQQQQQQQHFQKLKVEDALSYLDQVKIRFANDPGIYNKFLDIMKEFKSQSIDTPGVINRVSQLFHGHPDLVLGFNAFLPPGYRIEVPKNGVAFLQSPFSAQVSPGHQGKSAPLSSVAPPSGSASATGVESGPALTSEIKVTPSESQSSSSNTTTTTTATTPTGPSDPPSRLSLPLTSRENQPTTSSPPASETSPVEFDSAISYVNKIKNRFLDHPEIYRAFLEILHTYQKEQLEVKESRGSRGSSGMTEDEVFSKVASLFKGQEDLLAEFGQFLPDAKRSLFTGSSLTGGKEQLKRPEDDDLISKQNKKRPRPILLQHMSPLLKKKMKYSCTKDQSFASVGKHGVLREFSFFDKVRRLFKSQEVYENFLRCIALFNQEVVSGAELLQLVTPFLGKFPELYTQFKSFLGDKELSHAVSGLSDRYMEGGGGREVDYASCKRLGSSYRALPKTYQQPKCSGRTALCKEVLNDTWVSFPSWSEDSTFVSSKKTPYEEQLHRCEDERFENILQAFRESKDLQWPPTADDMELPPENLLPTDLVRFLSVVMAGKEDMETNEKMKRLVFSIGQDLCRAVSEGEWKLPKQNLFRILHRLGHSESYGFGLELETALAKVLDKVSSYRTPAIVIGEGNMVFHCEWDHLNKTTPSVHGSNIVTSAGGIMVQVVKPGFESNKVRMLPVIDKSQQRSLKVNTPETLAPLHFSRADIRYIGSNGQLPVPGLGGFTSATGTPPLRKSTVDYFTPIHQPITDDTVVRELLKRSELATDQVGQRMALLRVLTHLPPTCGEICLQVLDQMVAKKHFLFSTDRYHPGSIQAQESLRRGSSEKILLAGPATRKPYDFKMFLTNDDNEKQLCCAYGVINRQLQGWREQKGQGWSWKGEPVNFSPQMASPIVYQVEVRELPTIYSNQEETDTRVVLYRHHAAALGQTIYLDTGSGKHGQLLNPSELAESLGEDYCATLLGFFVFSGEDCTSAFKGKGKVGPLKKQEKNPKFHRAFSQLGDNWNVKPEVLKQ